MIRVIFFERNFMLKIIPIALLLIAACLVGVIIARKIPLLSLIDIESVPKSKEEEVKKRILTERIRRKLRGAERYLKIFARVFKMAAARVQIEWQKIKAMERRLKMKNIAEVDSLLNEAEENSLSNPVESERIYLEIIRIDSKNIRAYEGLAKIYKFQKEYKEAKEIFNFLIKINPQDSIRYTFELAEIELEEHNFAKALELATQVIISGSLEPRYLDFLIEAAILNKDSALAKEALVELEKINPDNAKIEEFEKRIRELS